MIRGLRVMVAVVAWCAMATTAAAEPWRCQNARPYKRVLVEYAANGFLPTAQARMADGNILDILTDGEGRFEILVTSPQGKSCPLAGGDRWRLLQPGRDRSGI